MRTQEAKTTIIREVSTPLNMPVDSLDLPTLRLVFADLFDRVSEAILAAKLDADDVLLERSVTLRTADGTTFSAPVDWLSDRERLLADLQLKARGGGLVMVAATVRAVAGDSP